MRRFILIIAAAAISLSAAAQPEPSGPGCKTPGESGPRNMEQLESAKIGFFTTRMELTPEEASKFWPVYNEYNKALCDARKATRDNYRAIRELADKGSYSEVEMKRLLIKYTEDCVKDDELERLYLDEFLKILPVDKVARMYIAEEEFRDKMIKMWKKPGKDNDPQRPEDRPGREKPMPR
jgi:Spy/CpxP family protein refolding chaperone